MDDVQHSTQNILSGVDILRHEDLFILCQNELKRIEKFEKDLTKYKPLIKLFDKAEEINELS